MLQGLAQRLVACELASMDCQVPNRCGNPGQPAKICLAAQLHLSVTASLAGSRLHVWMLLILELQA